MVLATTKKEGEISEVSDKKGPTGWNVGNIDIEDTLINLYIGYKMTKFRK